MSETQDLRTIGGTIAIIGVVALLIGLAVPATSTHTSETCVDDPTGFGQECMSGSVTTPNPLRGPIMGVGFLAILGGIFLMSGNSSSSQEVSRTSQGVTDGGFADKLREHQDDSESIPDTKKGSTFADDTPHESIHITDSPQNLHPLQNQVPDFLAYPVLFVVGAIAGGLAISILAALIGGSEGVGFLGGLLIGAIWGVVAWYCFSDDKLHVVSVGFTYLLVMVSGVFVMDGIIALLGFGDTSLAGETMFVLGFIGILAGWHYTRRNYLPEFITA